MKCTPKREERKKGKKIKKVPQVSAVIESLHNNRELSMGRIMHAIERTCRYNRFTGEQRFALQYQHTGGPLYQYTGGLSSSSCCLQEGINRSSYRSDRHE